MSLSADAKLTGVRAIVFDAVGTLITPKPRVASAYHHHGRRHGSQLSESEVSQRFQAAFAEQEAIDRAPTGGITDEARERRRWGAIVKYVFHDLDETDELLDALWNHFAQPASWRLYDDVPVVWRQLCSQGYRLAIASNFDGRLRQLIAGLPTLSGCAHLYISSMLGTRKPDPAFFAAVAADLNCPPDELLMVGDDELNDIQPAEEAGWRALRLCREGSSDDPQCISSLTDLPSLLS